MRQLAKVAFLAAVVLFPVLAHAQQLAGVVRDASGAVLPGVTVEASSPALIEKVRTAVTDGAGLYRIDACPRALTRSPTRCRASARSVATASRCTTGVTVTINAEMRVGGSGDDHRHRRDAGRRRAEQHARPDGAERRGRRRAAGVPRLRQPAGHVLRRPGQRHQNSGTDPTMVFFTSRGGRSNEGTVQIDGMNVGSAFNGGGVAGYGYDTRAPRKCS